MKYMASARLWLFSIFSVIFLMMWWFCFADYDYASWSIFTIPDLSSSLIERFYEIHFNWNWIDLAWWFILTDITEWIFSGNWITISIEWTGNYVTCYNQYQWFYRNYTRWNLLFPLDNETKDSFSWDWNWLDIEWWFYTNCDFSTYVWGTWLNNQTVIWQISYDYFDGSNTYNVANLQIWRKYSYHDNWIDHSTSWSEYLITSLFENFDLPQFEWDLPVWVIYDDLYWLWLVGCSFPNNTDFQTFVEQTWSITSMFSWVSEIDISWYTWDSIEFDIDGNIIWCYITNPFSLILQQILSVIWQYWLSRWTSNNDYNYTKVINDLGYKKSYTWADSNISYWNIWWWNINISDVLNQSSKNINRFCDGIWNKYNTEIFDDNDVGKTYCIDDELSSENIFISEDLTLNWDVTNIYVKNRNIVVNTSQIGLDDWHLNLYVDNWYVLFQTDTNTWNLIEVNKWWYPIYTNSWSLDSEWFYFNWNIVVNWLVAWINWTTIKPFEHKLYVNWALISLNTPSDPSIYRIKIVNDLSSKRDDVWKLDTAHIALKDVFVWRCNNYIESWSPWLYISDFDGAKCTYPSRTIVVLKSNFVNPILKR